MSAILRFRDTVDKTKFHDVPAIRGYSAYQIAVKNGYTGTEAEWVASITGVEGKSAYEVAKETGYTGTKAEWILSLKGEKGDTGANGVDGKNAYQLAVQEGYEGSLTAWLASLKGPKGDKGDAGVTSFNNRTGAIMPASGDYDADKITETETNKFVSPAEKATWDGKLDKAGGTMTGAIVAHYDSTKTKQVFNCQVSTTNLTAGTSTLESGVLYIVYE
jgi:hypothetical protein